jgi:hypothetical protein
LRSGKTDQRPECFRPPAEEEPDPRAEDPEEDRVAPELGADAREGARLGAILPESRAGGVVILGSEASALVLFRETAEGAASPARPALRGA